MAELTGVYIAATFNIHAWLNVGKTIWCPIYKEEAPALQGYCAKCSMPVMGK